MKIFSSHRKDFFITLAIGSALVILIILLGSSFFNAISTTQSSARKEFLRKQTGLAATGLENELKLFQESTDLIMDYMEDSDLDEDDFQDDLTKSVKRIFRNYPGLVDTIYVDLKDSILFFTQTPRNDFIRKQTSFSFPVINQSPFEYWVNGKVMPFRILVRLNPIQFASTYAQNFYINPGGKKLIYLNGKIWDLEEGELQEKITTDSKSGATIAEDLRIGVLGVYESQWLLEGVPTEGILTQYPFNFGTISGDAALLFIEESESIVSGIYNTYFLLYIGLIVLIIGTVLLFAISLKNNLESQRLLAENSEEISELFDQQNLLLKELKGFVFYHDAKGNITRISDEVSQVLGIPKSRFLHAFNNQSGQKDASRIRELIKKALFEKKSYVDFEYQYTSRENNKVHLRIFEKLVFDQDGKFNGGIGICTDITSQFESRQELVESENRLRTLIENIPDILFIHNNEGVILDYQIKDADLNISPNFGLIGRKLSEIVPANQVETVLKGFNQARKTGTIQTVDYRAEGPNGTRFFEVRYFPLDDQKVMSISKDITAQRIWEKGLLEAMNASDQASKAKSEFLANMSHEIRTPMNGLLGIIDLLEQTELDEIQTEYMNIIKSSGNSLLAIIKDILDYSKIEAGKIEIHPTAFVPKIEFQKQVLILSGLAKKKKINLSIEFGENTEKTLEGDLEKLMQVFLNLVGNAIKFTPKNGDVKIFALVDKITDELVQLKISVLDSGIGISEELIPHLTDPFYQVESSSTRPFQGTGLGLAISKRLVELLGGELNVTSKLNEGSNFTFTAILKEVKDHAIESVNPIAPERQNWIGMASDLPLRILLAEDNDLNLQLMNLMLTQLGYSFKIAKNGKEAVESLSEFDFDLILMDVQMPVLNGLEATRLIRKMPAKDALVIIGLSANVYDEDQKKALESGMNDYLTKPIRLVALAEKLKFYATSLLAKSK